MIRRAVTGLGLGWEVVTAEDCMRWCVSRGWDVGTAKRFRADFNTTRWYTLNKRGRRKVEPTTPEAITTAPQSVASVPPTGPVPGDKLSEKTAILLEMAALADKYGLDRLIKATRVLTDL